MRSALLVLLRHHQRVRATIGDVGATGAIKHTVQMLPCRLRDTETFHLLVWVSKKGVQTRAVCPVNPMNILGSRPGPRPELIKRGSITVSRIAPKKAAVQI